MAVNLAAGMVRLGLNRSDRFECLVPPRACMVVVHPPLLFLTLPNVLLGTFRSSSAGAALSREPFMWTWVLRNFRGPLGLRVLS